MAEGLQALMVEQRRGGKDGRTRSVQYFLAEFNPLYWHAMNKVPTATAHAKVAPFECPLLLFVAVGAER